MKAIPAVVEASFDEKKIARAIDKVHISLQDGERELAAFDQKTIGIREANARKRIEIGRLLLEAKRSIKHGGWLPFLEQRGIEQQRASDWMRLAGHAAKSPTFGDDGDLPTLADAGIDRRPRVAELHVVEHDEETQPDPPKPRADPQYGSARPADSLSGAEAYDSDEWYTPIEYIDAAREVLGDIDLDPATCTHAQSRIKATRFHTKDDDGLTKEWHGRLWLNPPYSQPAAAQFAEKLLAEHKAGRVTAAVLVQNASTDTAWFHTLARHGSICLTRGRISFDRENGKGTQNRNGQVFFYLGDDHSAFERVFARFGLVGRLRGID